MIIGVISDTHGLLRPEALEALGEAGLIIHAGDIGSPAILETLSSIAPVHAIRGNVDTAAWARSIPETRVVELGRHRFYVIHDCKQLRIDPQADKYDCVISGHSHKPSTEDRSGVLYLNPGSAGKRRFRLPITVARIRLLNERLEPEIVYLEADNRRADEKR